MFKKFFVILFLISSGVVSSQELEFFGEAKPGSIVIMKGEEVKYAILNGDTLQVDPRGYFVFGFDRDQTGDYLLKVKLGSGKVIFKRFKISKRKYKIQRINNLKKKYVTPPKKELDRIARERKIIKEKRKAIGLIDSALYASGFIRPVKGGVLTSRFGSQRILNGKPKNAHNGLDIAAPRGTPVYAMADGVVRFVADNFYYSGNFIIIDHGQGLNSSYLHLSKTLVKEGDFVKKGEKIGEIGTTGRSTGPHLHWSVQWYNKRVDPAVLLKIKFN